CDISHCNVCYALQEPSEVAFDSLQSGRARPVRQNFGRGTRQSGSQEAVWNEDDDMGKPVGRGTYLVRLRAQTHDNSFTSADSDSFELPDNTPTAKSCADTGRN